MSYQMSPTKIEWVGPPGYRAVSWNPLGWGCTGGCPWCYARAIAKRFGDKACDQYPTAEQVERFGLAPEHTMCSNFFPHFHPERLEAPLHTRKACGVFLQSMGDLWDPNVKPEWRQAIWEIVEQCPEHIFWVLTKQAARLYNSREDSSIAHLKNLWVGVSIEDSTKESRWRFLGGMGHDRRFISFEPLQWTCAAVQFDLGNLGWIDMPGWIIVGAETGNRKGRIVPKPGWVSDIVERAESVGIPVFVKDNLAAVMGEAYVKAHQQWPEGMGAGQT